MAAEQPAPRFYVDVRQALCQYKYFKNGTSHIRHPAKRAMYAEIFARYESAMSQISAENRHIFRNIVMERVLQQQAPSFYYDEHSAVKLYYRFMQEKRLYNNI